MDKKSFESLYHDAAEALLSRRMHDALDCLQGILFSAGSTELDRELDSIRQDYAMMLNFMVQGGNDPQRAAIHRNLTARGFAMLDKGARLYYAANEKDLYTETLNRCYGDAAETFDMLVGKAGLLRDKRRETPRNAYTENEESAYYATFDKLFEYVWTAPLLHPSDAEKLKAFIEEQEIEEQALLLSAVMLNVQRYFDPQKYRILLHFCHAEATQVRARALTAAVWTYMQYEARFAHYPDLADGLSLLVQDERLKGELILLQRQCLLSLETAKAEKKLQNEIFPDMLKNRNYQRNKMGLGQMEEDLAKALRGEPNAEWEHMQGNKQLADNLKQIIAMGKEGIDINLGTFSGLKGFSFFQSLPHWFALFQEHRPEVKGIFPPGIAHNPIKMLMESGNFCNSDKFSLCMMLNQLPSSQREMMVTQIGSQVEGQEENLKAAMEGQDSSANIYRSLLQDLYRFFKLYPRKRLFYDPFQRDMLFTRYKVLAGMLKSPAYLRDTASFLIRRECYQDAIDYIEETLKTETADAELLQKVAFCYQHLDQPDKAIYYYQQADLLSPDNEWILKQMHLCYSALGRYEQELGCLKNLEAMNPGNAQLLSEIGLCLMQLGRYDEAVQRFYELEYKGERVLSSWRAIAWCNFKMGRLEQADKFYKKLLQGAKPTWEDYLNAGHTAWCSQNPGEALTHYRQYIQLYSKEKKDAGQSPFIPFDEDRKELLQHGIAELDICLMRDLLQQGQA